MSNQPSPNQTPRNRNAQRFTGLDYSRIADEVRQGGIHAIPAFMVSRWGLSMADARNLIRKYQNHQ